MAIALEKRIRKLESRAGVGRCDNPDHASVFFIDPNNKPEKKRKLNQCVRATGAATGKH
jgi:hypothetical protein